MANRRFSKLLLLVVLLLTVSCVSNKKNKESVVLSEQEMYDLAMKNFDEKLYRTAAESFEKIEEKFVFTPIATRSIIMAIYSYYKAKKYDDSLRLIEYYKKINFSNEYLNYIYYMEILNKYNKSQKAKKDLNLLNELIADINNFARYDTKYKDDILNKRKKVVDRAVHNELNIYHFYMEQNNLIGAMNHLQNILDNYPENKYTPEVLYRLMLLYKHINYKEGVDECLNLLEKNYKKTKWYRYAL